MAGVPRRQVRAIGHPFALSPVMDVAGDARWGRVHETYGEDPYLAPVMSVAFTRGMQGTDGVPAGASREVLTDLLRDRLGFTGTVVSDYDPVGHLHRRLRVARDAEEVGRLALAAGRDIELPIAGGYGPVLAQAVERGAVPLEQLDQACWRVLRDKFALGLFDQPYVPEGPVVINATARAGADLAHDLARQSVTLLKNEGVQPLSRDLRRIAIISPHADSIGFAFAAYTYPGALQMFAARWGEQRTIPGTEQMAAMVTDETIRLMIEELSGPLGKPTDDSLRAMYGARSLAEAVRAAVPDAGVTVTAGCGVLDEEPADIPAAVAAAGDADVVILALGGRGGWFPPNITEGEGSDTANLDLPANQVALVRPVAETGTPCVGIVHTGRPMALAAVVDALPALLYDYGGQHATTAMTEVLFGDVSRGGKLLISLPRHSGQVPIYSGQPTGSGSRRTEHDMHKGYLDLLSTPLFPFGHGLSYTTFDYTDLAISPLDVGAAVDVDAAVTVRLTVRHSGERAGDKVVQLYFADQATGVTRPAQELVGFTRISLAPGAAATVAFTMAMSQLGYVGLDGCFVLEPGPVQVLVGSTSDDIRLRGAFEVVGEPVVLEGRRSSLSSTAATRRPWHWHPPESRPTVSDLFESRLMPDHRASR